MGSAISAVRLSTESARRMKRRYKVVRRLGERWRPLYGARFGDRELAELPHSEEAAKAARSVYFLAGSFHNISHNPPDEGFAPEGQGHRFASLAICHVRPL